MNNILEFPKRTIHLDFHTDPWVPEVGRDFSPEEFAQTFKDEFTDSEPYGKILQEPGGQ